MNMEKPTTSFWDRFGLNVKTNNYLKRAPKLPLLLFALLAVGLVLTISQSQKSQESRGRAAEPPTGYVSATVGETTYNEPTDEQNIFYVSPSGNDSSDGQTRETPWKSFAKTASVLTSGQMAIFEDGTYFETTYLNNGLPNSGAPDQPIVFKSETKHGATLYFPDSAINTYKIYLGGPDNIVFRDFQMTQSRIGDSSQYGDKIIWVFGDSDNIYILGNRFSNAQTPVKTTYNDHVMPNFVPSTNTIVDSNFFENCVVCLSSLGGKSGIFRNNEIANPIDDGIQSKGHSRNVQIYNNYIHSNRPNMKVGIYVGGNGWESHNNVAYNNIIVSANTTTMKAGIAIVGCHNCAAYNNIIIGPETGFSSIESNWGSMGDSGNTEYKYTRNPKIYNNIVMDCTYGKIFDSNGNNVDSQYITGLSMDYNLFYNCSNPLYIPTQSHAVTGDPLLVNKGSDWHFQTGSPAIGAGTPVTFSNLDGVSLDVSKDKNGVSRSTTWDLGIYANAADISTTSSLTPTPTSPAFATPTPTTTSVLPTSTPFQSVAAPSDVTATSDVSKISVNWNASTTPNVTYNLYRGWLPETVTLYKQGLTTTSYTDTSIEAPTNGYWYKVKTRTSSGQESDFSNGFLIYLKPTPIPTSTPIPSPTPTQISVVPTSAPSQSSNVSSFMIEAESFSSTNSTVENENNASGDKGRVFYRNSSATTTVTTSNATNKVIVTARADVCKGNPRVVIRIDGKKAYTGYVNRDYWLHYPFGYYLPAGTHTINVSFDNDYYQFLICDRNLRVDKVTLQ